MSGGVHFSPTSTNINVNNLDGVANNNNNNDAPKAEKQKSGPGFCSRFANTMKFNMGTVGLPLAVVKESMAKDINILANNKHDKHVVGFAKGNSNTTETFMTGHKLDEMSAPRSTADKAGAMLRLAGKAALTAAVAVPFYAAYGPFLTVVSLADSLCVAATKHHLDGRQNSDIALDKLEVTAQGTDGTAPTNENHNAQQTQTVAKQGNNEVALTAEQQKARDLGLHKSDHRAYLKFFDTLVKKDGPANNVQFRLRDNIPNEILKMMQGKIDNLLAYEDFNHYFDSPGTAKNELEAVKQLINTKLDHRGVI